MPLFIQGAGERADFGGVLGARASRVLRQDLGQVDFGMRRFRLRGGPAREQLEDSGRAFLTGFNHAVSISKPDVLDTALGEVPGDFRGFAFEGAGMACAVLDLVTLSRGRRLRALLEGAGAEYPHLIHVGAGWAFARLRLRPWRALRAGDPLLRWLAWDGFGFYQGFFDSDRAVGGQRVPTGLDQAQREVRDQGLGRCLWFHECADPEALRLRVAEFPRPRRADLWSGIGLAATYAGGASEDELRALTVAAGEYRAHLAQGAAFACAARLLAGSPLPAHCASASVILTGVSAEVAAGWTDIALSDLGPKPGSGAHYRAWRIETRRLWAAHDAPGGDGAPVAFVRPARTSRAAAAGKDTVGRRSNG